MILCDGIYPPISMNLQMILTSTCNNTLPVYYTIGVCAGDISGFLSELGESPPAGQKGRTGRGWLES
jgi:hypothetical protein